MDDKKGKTINEIVNYPKFWQHVLPKVYKIFEKTQDPKKIQKLVTAYLKVKGLRKRGSQVV